jgi:ubiquinone/menaquinone biosynthesis C-methylase UbiE
MDDKTFDDIEAQEWIKMIEAAQPSIRDQDIYPIIDSWIHKNNLKNILDLGCGQGICSEEIDLVGRSYTGVEPSRLMVNRAQELYQSGNRRFVEGNVYELPFADQSFDGVFSILVWHLLSDLETATSELFRVLDLGGKFHIITANPASYRTWKSFYKDVQVVGKRLEGTMQLSEGLKSKDTLFLHSLDEIVNSLQKVSLTVSHMETFRESECGENIFISFSGSKS